VLFSVMHPSGRTETLKSSCQSSPFGSSFASTCCHSLPTMRQSRPAHGKIARPRNQDAVALSVTRETPVAAIGIDSLVMTDLSGAIGDEFGARVRFADLERAALRIGFDRAD
jgi:Phosphopantetheine attachment site